MKNLNKKKLMNSSTKTILLFLGIFLAIAVVVSSNAPEINSDETNNTGEIKPNLAATYQYQPYAFFQSYNIEYNVEETLVGSGNSNGDGVFHINGKTIYAIWTTSTTRANLIFGFNNPEYAARGAPISYGVRATIRYRNWNDVNGYVKLYIKHDDDSWFLIWQKTDVGGNSDITWNVIWASSSAAYYRSDGSMNFKVVGTSWTDVLLNRPSCKINVDNLRVRLNYGPHASYDSYTSEYNVNEHLVSGGDSKGTGVFHIKGKPCAFWFGESSTTRANLIFGFYNPYHYQGGPPASWKIKATVRYRNWNDVGGWVELYVLRNDGVWILMWQKTNLNGVDSTWDMSWTRDHLDYYRSDGFMYFKIRGSSTTYNWGEKPSCKVNMHNLRVELQYRPKADGGGPYVDTEGSPVTFDASGSTEATGDTLWYKWDFDKNGYYDTDWSTNPIAEHTYYDDFVGLARVWVYDGTYSDYDTFAVYILNLPPTVDLGPDREVDEGLVHFSSSITDPGTLDTHAYEWDFGDGSPVSGSSSHTYADDGTYTVTLTVEDDDGGVDTDTMTVTVNNVAPTVTAGPDQTVNEGTLVHFDGWFTDPGSADTHTIEWDFGEGAGFSELYTMTPSNYYQDDGIYTVTVRVTDDYDEVGTDTMTVTVNNVAPTVDAGSDQTVNEGQIVSVIGTFTDPGSADTHTVLWDFGDGSLPSTLGSHVYADNGVYTVTMTVTDDDNGVGSDTLIVSVNNVAPTVDAGDDQTVDEGQIVSVIGTFTDPGSADTHTILWDFGDGSLPSALGSHVYADNGVYTVTMTVTDDDDGVGSDILTVLVNNVAPTADAGPDQAINQGDEANFIGTFTDPGSADTHTILWDFGDGSPTSDTGSHVYGEYGIYTVTLIVSDDDGGIDSDTLTVIVMDITDPTTTLTFEPQFGEEEPYYVSTTTQFVLTAVDNPFGSGIAIIQYRIGDEVEWSTYIGPFSISDIGGPYTVYYRSTDIAGNTEQAKSVDVIVNASELSYDGEISGDYSDPVILEATLIDIATQELISGKTIVFTIGTQTISAETINGVACVTLILDQPGGDYSVSASFLNDGEYLASSDESAFTINKENALAEYTGNLVVSTHADTITLRATIFDEIDGNWGDLTKIFVSISILDSWTLEMLYNSGALQVETTVVEGVGIAIITIPNTLPEEGYFVKISFDPDENDYYCGDTTDYVTLIIYEPIGDFVTGGGWIEDADGNKGNFGFNVKYKKNGAPKGQAIFVYKEGDYTVIVKANAWVGMAIISEDNYTIFEAKCNVKKVDQLTGEVIWEEGNYRLVIEAWDNSNDGKEDVIQIRVYDKIGIVFHEAGFDPYGILGGGNIVIHVDDKKK